MPAHVLAQEMDNLQQRSAQLGEQLQRKSEEVQQKKKGMLAIVCLAELVLNCIGIVIAHACM